MLQIWVITISTMKWMREATRVRRPTLGRVRRNAQRGGLAQILAVVLVGTRALLEGPDPEAGGDTEVQGEEDGLILQGLVVDLGLGAILEGMVLLLVEMLLSVVRLRHLRLLLHLSLLLTNLLLRSGLTLK